MSKVGTPRECVVHTAQHWYDSGREAALRGDYTRAYLYLVNAFNHTENALSATLRAATFKDQPPVSGLDPISLDALRAKQACGSASLIRNKGHH